MSDSFKDDLPENCPWPGCSNPSRSYILYRLIKEDKPTEGDFKSHYQANPSKRNSYKRKDKTHCMSKGVSFHATQKASENLKRLPKFRQHKAVIQLELNEASGVVSPVDDSKHVTCWFYSQTNPLELIIETK